MLRGKRYPYFTALSRKVKARGIKRRGACASALVAAQELLCALLLRAAEHILGRALLDDHAAGHEDDAGGNGAGVSMTPLGFIAVEQGRVRVIELGNILTYDPPRDLVNRTLDGINGIIDKTPSIVEKILNLFGRKGADEEADDTAGQPQNEENSED